MSAVARWGFAVVIAAGLGVQAYTHLDLAHNYALNTTGSVNEGVLFRVEAGLAIAAAIFVLIRPGLLSAIAAAAVAGGGATALIVYRYANVGKLGPLPNMYEPVWFHEKEISLAGELVALAAAVALLGATVLARCPAHRSGAVTLPG
jgi:hypothetical protein